MYQALTAAWRIIRQRYDNNQDDEHHEPRVGIHHAAAFTGLSDS